MDRFLYGSPSLEPGESHVMNISNVSLYDGDDKTCYVNGELMLTTHKLLWCGNVGDSTGIYLSLPLSYVVYIEEEKSNALSFSKTKKIIMFLSEPLRGLNSPFSSSRYNFIKLSLKDRGDFLETLHQIVSAKKWNCDRVGTKQIPATVKLRTGIVGIERSIQEKQRATNETISIAFQDLNKLMQKAKEMVNVSKNISNKLKDKQGEITDDETIRFKSYLLGLGIDDPVTRNSFRSESEYFEKLGNEICNVIEGPLKDVGGLMTLADVYCRVNRARGLELVSPEDFLSGCMSLEAIKRPVILREFDSGVKVLQMRTQNDLAIVEETGQMLRDNGPLTPEQLSQFLGIPVILAKERLFTAEKHGAACRDESIEGLAFYVNKFLQN